MDKKQLISEWGDTLANMYGEGDKIPDKWKGKLPGTISTNARSNTTVPKEYVHDLEKAFVGVALGAPIAAAGPAFAAALANPVIGSGLGGAVLTSASMPTTSEAGILTPLGRYGGKLASKFKPGMPKGGGALETLGRDLHANKLNTGNAWIMSDGQKMFEIPTSGLAGRMLNGERFNTAKSSLKSSLKEMPNGSPYQKAVVERFAKENNLSFDDATQATFSQWFLKNKHRVAEIPNKQWRQKHMGNDEIAAASTYGYMKASNPRVSFVKKDLSKEDKLFTSIHEPGHGVDAVNMFRDGAPSTIGNTNYKLTTPYDKQIFEHTANIGAGRAKYRPILTKPGKYGVHPELTFDPKSKMFNLNSKMLHAAATQKDISLPKFALKEGGDTYMMQPNVNFISPKNATIRAKTLEKEKNRLNDLYRNNKKFKAIVDDGQYAHGEQGIW